MRDRGHWGVGHQPQPLAESIGCRIGLAELVQQPAIFLVGLGCRPQADDALEIAARLPPKFIAQAKPGGRKKQVGIVAALRQPALGALELLARVSALDEVLATRTLARPPDPSLPCHAVLYA